MKIIFNSLAFEQSFTKENSSSRFSGLCIDQNPTLNKLKKSWRWIILFHHARSNDLFLSMLSKLKTPDLPHFFADCMRGYSDHDVHEH